MKFILILFVITGWNNLFQTKVTTVKKPPAVQAVPIKKNFTIMVNVSNEELEKEARKKFY